MRHMRTPVDDPLATSLAEVVGAGHVLCDPDLRAPYETDWTRRWSAAARLVVRPADAAEVAAVLTACRRAGAPVVPQGGNTGLVGGGVPRGGEVVLSLTRLDGLGEVDQAAGQVTAGAGVTLAALRRHARAAGWDVGVDLAARDSATLGGMVATNAGGVHVLRHGMMRANVGGARGRARGRQRARAPRRSSCVRTPRSPTRSPPPTPLRTPRRTPRRIPPLVIRPTW
jgi:FAD/FMN-containing dehydrogenase